MTDHFRNVVLALRPYVSDTYALTDAADAIVALPARNDFPVIQTPDGLATWDWSLSRWSYHHDSLVRMALSNREVMDHVRIGKKILAIKVLRASTNCGLKAAKEAVEDSSVAGWFDEYDNPNAHFDADEPPF